MSRETSYRAVCHKLQHALHQTRSCCRESQTSFRLQHARCMSTTAPWTSITLPATICASFKMMHLLSVCCTPTSCLMYIGRQPHISVSLVVVGLQDDVQQQRQVCHPSLLPCTEGPCPHGPAGLLHLPILCVSAPGEGAVAALPGAPIPRAAAAAVPSRSGALPPIQTSHATPLSISATGILLCRKVGRRCCHDAAILLVSVSTWGLLKDPASDISSSTRSTRAIQLMLSPQILCCGCLQDSQATLCLNVCKVNAAYLF